MSSGRVARAVLPGAALLLSLQVGWGGCSGMSRTGPPKPGMQRFPPLVDPWTERRDDAERAQWQAIQRQRRDEARRRAELRDDDRRREEAEAARRRQAGRVWVQQRIDERAGLVGACTDPRYGASYACATGPSHAALLQQKHHDAVPYSATARRREETAEEEFRRRRELQARMQAEARAQALREDAAARLAQRQRRPMRTRAAPPEDCPRSVFGSCPEPNASLVSGLPGASDPAAPGYARAAASRGEAAALSCEGVADVYDQLLTFDRLRHPPASLRTRPGRISQAELERLPVRDLGLPPARRGAAVGLVRTSDGNYGKFLFGWSDGSDQEAPSVTLVDATVYTHDTPSGAPRVWAPILLGPYDGVDLDIPDAAAAGLADEVDLALRPDPDGELYLEAMNGAAVEFLAEPLCPDDRTKARTEP